ncbi:MAG TPA: YciI family protein [candidate division Zixibacteria bacterium]|nr:YciI family protein [candidate division Zixibacteria bacterium]
MADYLLLIRNGDFVDFSPEEIQGIIQKFSNWAARLREEGKLKDASKLADGGAVVKSSNGSIVDGPFTETKEAVGGFFLIEAADLAEATAVARGCPGLEYGDWVEVRPIEV